MDYIEVAITLPHCTELLQDVACAVLSDAGYESFVYTDDGLKAYIASALYAESALREALARLADMDVTDGPAPTWTAQPLDSRRDWNEAWEQESFDPVLEAAHGIRLMPRMAFGSGSHETTRMMTDLIMARHLEGLTCLDMGTGTGVLGIAMALRHARRVVMVDTDPNATANAADNCRLNGVEAQCDIRLGDATVLAGAAQPASLALIAANIHKNVLKADLPAYVHYLQPGGSLLLSGFYAREAAEMVQAAEARGLTHVQTRREGEWAAVELSLPCVPSPHPGRSSDARATAAPEAPDETSAPARHAHAASAPQDWAARWAAAIGQRIGTLGDGLRRAVTARIAPMPIGRLALAVATLWLTLSAAPADAAPRRGTKAQVHPRVEYARQMLDQALADVAPAERPDVRMEVVEGSALPREGFTITTRGGRTLITAADPSGVIYGVRTLIDDYIDRGNLHFPDSLTDAPEMVLRGTCIGIQKPYLLPGRKVYEYPLTPELFPWFYDKEMWIEVLDMMVRDRMNSLYLWNGHPFASLVRLDDYPFAIEVDDATFRKNQELYAFLTREADRRGIWVIQMFYNILVSKPFADHYGIATQDRNRPITPLLSDYTRQSIARFVEMYPNVGLLTCLGEAMATYDDDVQWMTETIIPGVYDGLKAQGRLPKDFDPSRLAQTAAGGGGMTASGLTSAQAAQLPPILLRAHDTDCRMVMEAALPLYPNLYTMHKYNGESLTTYQPRGPWAKIHSDLSSLGSTHIENVHILANLEPWRWSSPHFIQQAVGAMHTVHGANALHLYPQAAYWDYPFTADRIADDEQVTLPTPRDDQGRRRLRQIDRDWMWYEAWGRYAWRQARPRADEAAYWDERLARHYGLPQATPDLRIALEEAGEIAPKLLRRFGITEGNRQTLLLGMFCSQLVNPYKYTIYPGFYESCGPEGEKLIEWAEREWHHETHVGELPLDIVQECSDHAERACRAIDAIDLSHATRHADELRRLRGDIHCYRELAEFFRLKVQAARRVLDYRWGHDVQSLREAAALLEQSLERWRQLTALTEPAYLYANSMQTTMRRIPIAGDDGKNKHWAEMLPHYERELANLRSHIAILERRAAGIDTEADTAPLRPLSDALSTGQARLLSPQATTQLGVGATVMADHPEAPVEALADELVGLTALQTQGERQRQTAETIEWEAQDSVSVLVAFFRDDQKKYAKAPTLETDATANDHGQAEARLRAAIHLEGMPLADVHAYTYPAGRHRLRLPVGYSLVVGMTTDRVAGRTVGLDGDTETLDWLFY